MEDSNTLKRVKIASGFSKFVPTEFVDYVVDLFFSSPVIFKIVKPRKTKLGDFRVDNTGSKPIITINGNLNPYAFLITTVHEFAHYKTFLKFGFNVSAHGTEWKHEFRQLLLPIIDANKLPKDIEQALLNSLVSTKATTCSDHHLTRALNNYNKIDDGLKTLEMLPKNTKFALDNRVFVKGDLRRKKYLCQEFHTNKMYLVNALAHVKPLD